MTREFFIAIDPITTVHMGICNAPNTLRRAAALAEAVKERHQAFMSDPSNLQEYAAMHYMERPAEVQGVGIPGRQADVLRSLSAVVFAVHPYVVAYCCRNDCLRCVQAYVFLTVICRLLQRQRRISTLLRKKKKPQSQCTGSTPTRPTCLRGEAKPLYVSVSMRLTMSHRARRQCRVRGGVYPPWTICCWELMRCCGCPRQAV
jgi:hypothetical protein